MLSLKFWLCINEPEICDFMTNDLRGGELSILKCDKCRDGYLIIDKEGKGDPFLGCTNYRSDKTGCDGFMVDIRNPRPFFHKCVYRRQKFWSAACSEKIIFYICSAGAIWQINMEVYSRDLHLKI